MSDTNASHAIDSFMQAMQSQRCVTSEPPPSSTQSRSATEEDTASFASPPPRCPRAPTIATAAAHSVPMHGAGNTTAEDGAAAIRGPLAGSDSDEDLDTTQSEFIATRMFFNQTQLVGDASPIARAPARGSEVGFDEPEACPLRDDDGMAPLHMTDDVDAPMLAEENFSPLARLPTSLAAEVKGNHTPSKSLPTPDVTVSIISAEDEDDDAYDEEEEEETAHGGTEEDSHSSAAFDRSTCRPSRDDSEFFFVDNHDGTGYLTNATRQTDGSYLLGQTVLLAQSQSQNQGSPITMPSQARGGGGAVSPVVVPPSANASPLPHQRRLHEDTVGEAAAEFDLGATQNLMMNQSFTDSQASPVFTRAGGRAGGALDASLSMGSFASPSISRIIARARNDRACGATPVRGEAPVRRSAAPARTATAAKQLAFDSSLALDSSFVLMDQTLLGQSLRTNLGDDGLRSGFSSPMFGSPLPRRQRSDMVPSLDASFSVGGRYGAGADSGAASPMPDAPTEEPYLVREARAEREPGVDRVYVAAPTTEVTADALSAQGWVPIFVDFRRKPTDFEITPTSQSPIPNDPRRPTGAAPTTSDSDFTDVARAAELDDAMMEGEAAGDFEDDEDNMREASLSRIDALDSSLASLTALDQTVLRNINRRLSMSMSSLYPGTAAGSPRGAGAGAGAVLASNAMPPSTPLGQILRRQSSSTMWGAQSPLPLPPGVSETPFKREGSPSRASMAASFSVGPSARLTDLMTSMSMPQRPTVGSGDWYGTSGNTAFLSNTEGSMTTTTTATNGALSYSAQASPSVPTRLLARRRLSNTTATTTTTTGSVSPGASMGLGGRSMQSVGLGNSFRVTHCKRASMGPTMLKGAMPLSRGHLSASTSVTHVHVDAASHTHTAGAAGVRAHPQHHHQTSTPPEMHTPVGPVHGRPVNRGHQLDCAAPVRRTTREKPDTSAFVPWSPLTITPESSIHLESDWNATGLTCPTSPASPPRNGQSTMTAPGYSPPEKLREAMDEIPAQEMRWVPFTASMTTTTTTTEEEAISMDDGSCEGRPSLSLAASGISPAALQALRDGILAAMQQPPPSPSQSAHRSVAPAREDMAASSRAMEPFAASLLGGTVMENFAVMDSAATSAMMHSITLFAVNELHAQQTSQSTRPSMSYAASAAGAGTGDDAEPEPRLSTAVVASIAQRWIAEQQRAGKENCREDFVRGVSAGSKRTSKSASASPGRQPSLSARAPSEMNTHRDATPSS